VKKLTQAEINRELFPIFEEVERSSYLEQLLEQGGILAIMRGTGKSIPVVHGERRRDSTGRIAAVEITCPWCRTTHWHGAGPKLYDGDGHRGAHCLNRDRLNSGYFILERRESAGELARSLNALPRVLSA
jgi:hypothetical protein